MEATALWNTVLTIGVAIVGMYVKNALETTKSQQILLAKTREEMREKYVHKDDMKSVTDQINARFDRIEEKIDKIIGNT